MKNQQVVNQSNTRVTIILAVIACILCIPLIAMQFTSEVNWTLSDFIVAGVLLFGTGLAIELAIRYINPGIGRSILLIIILLALFLIWAELAVGIFGSPLAGS